MGKGRLGQTALFRGFSLVELLVALLLGVILSSGMITVYLGAKQGSFYEEQLARMQENGRLAMRLLSRELVMAGFFAGTRSLDGVLPPAVGADCSDDNWVLDASRPLGLVNDHTGQSVPVAVDDTPLTCVHGEEIVSETDLLVVKRTAGEPSLRDGVVADRLTESTVRSWYLRLVPGEPWTWEKAAPGELAGLAASDPMASYWKGMTRIFYVRRYSDPDDRDDDIPTLCMETIAGDGMASRCLVEGVEDVQYEFGIDTDADGVPNQYLSAPSEAELGQAVTVKVHLLLRSIRKVSGWVDEKAYVLGARVLSPRRDSYLRRVLSTTVFLRNHGKQL